MNSAGCGALIDGRCMVQAGAQKQLETMVQKHPEMADVVKAKLELMKSVKRGTITQQELQETWEGFDAFFGALDNVRSYPRVACKGQRLA